MASVRKLPSDDVLRKHVEDGMTTADIATKYDVSHEAVRQVRQRAGVPAARQRPTHAHYIPWGPLRGDHVGHLLVRRLRSYSKREQGRELSASDARRLDEWLAYMDGANPLGVPLSVWYERTDEQGFWLAPRGAGDRNYIHPPS